MKMRRSESKRHNARIWPLGISLILIILGVVLTSCVLAGLLWWQTREGDAKVQCPPAAGFVLEGELLCETWQPHTTSGDQLLVPASLLRDVFEAPIHLESDSDDTTRVIWSLPHGVLDMRPGESFADIGNQKIQLLAPVQMIDDAPHIPADFVSVATDLRFNYYESSDRVVIRRIDAPQLKATLKHNDAAPGAIYDSLLRSVAFWRSTDIETALRTMPDRTAPILKKLSDNSEVHVHRSRDGWALVETEGILGYVPITNLEMEEVSLYESEEKTGEGGPPMTDWSEHRPGQNISGERVSLVWEYVGRAGTRNPSELPPLDDGINVVSPTWFHLADEQGRFENRADLRYVHWAHEQDIAVWALASNSFDPELTSAVLRSRERRANMIEQLVAFAEMYNLDGLNIDFENVYYEDRDYLTQFVRELTPAAHHKDLTISIDVTAISGSPTWSMCYDRQALAEIVDYVILMGYDEYSRGSSVPGPVSSLPWVERSIRNMLPKVPRHKFVLGIPFYMRLWEQSTQEGEEGLSSRAVDMHWLRNLPDELKNRIEWDADNALNYLEYEKDGKQYSVWIEDEHSIAARLQLMHKYQLAGVAAWRRGFETPDAWQQIAEAIRWWPR